ncbi:OmpH family outer membrane protein [Mucilaginibacter calamicampi]|uniref:OmpH family outer membrane protein n=1 Tax=Mucilaginibacter calamicampi TaxID=1302352 RepID=A0ABW2YVV3_9SPHI
MKKVFKVALVAVCIMLAGNFAKAQSKIGYIAQEEVISALPEAKTVQKQLEDYSKTWTDQLGTLNNTYQKTIKEYQDQEKTMTDAAKAAKIAEIQDMQKRLDDQQTLARQSVDAKSNEWSKPLFDKVRGAINAVAKEKGYAYVINTSQTELLVAPDADNLLAAVKAKLGLK